MVGYPAGQVGGCGRNIFCSDGLAEPYLFGRKSVGVGRGEPAGAKVLVGGQERIR